MAAKQTEQYDIQVISQRYIRMALFEEYVNSKIDRFGENWSYSVARDNRITFTALEPLSEASSALTCAKVHATDAASGRD